MRPHETIYRTWLASLALIRLSRLSAIERGDRLLQFVLASGMTAPLEEVELDLVDAAAQRAIVQVPTVLSPTDVLLVETLSELRHRIAGVFRFRRHLASQTPAVPSRPPQGGDRPGQPASILPPPPPTLSPVGEELVVPGTRATFAF